MKLILRWGLNAVALMLVPELVTDLRVESYSAALISALLLGLVNALIRPLLILVTLYLQYALWFERGGIQDVEKLREAVEQQRAPRSLEERPIRLVENHPHAGHPGAEGPGRKTRGSAHGV